MEAIRHIIDSELLSGVISLPRDFQNKKIEIIVFLKEEETLSMPRLTIEDIDEMLKGSITESLIGSVPQSYITLNEYRAERLSKYESVD